MLLLIKRTHRNKINFESACFHLFVFFTAASISHLEIQRTVSLFKLILDKIRSLHRSFPLAAMNLQGTNRLRRNCYCNLEPIVRFLLLPLFYWLCTGLFLAEHKGQILFHPLNLPQNTIQSLPQNCWSRRNASPSVKNTKSMSGPMQSTLRNIRWPPQTIFFLASFSFRFNGPNCQLIIEYCCYVVFPPWSLLAAISMIFSTIAGLALCDFLRRFSLFLADMFPFNFMSSPLLTQLWNNVD